MQRGQLGVSGITHLSNRQLRVEGLPFLVHPNIQVLVQDVNGPIPTLFVKRTWDFRYWLGAIPVPSSQ